MTIRAAAAIVFDAHHRILLVRRARPPETGLWSVPGGKCGPGETSAAACVRETLEETGLLVTVKSLAGSVERQEGAGEKFGIDDYLCEVLDGRLRAGDDASAVRWASRADLARLELAPAGRGVGFGPGAVVLGPDARLMGVAQRLSPARASSAPKRCRDLLFDSRVALARLRQQPTNPLERVGEP